MEVSGGVIYAISIRKKNNKEITHLNSKRIVEPKDMQLILIFPMEIGNMIAPNGIFAFLYAICVVSE